jgi:hypothetical protein
MRGIYGRFLNKGSPGLWEVVGCSPSPSSTLTGTSLVLFRSDKRAAGEECAQSIYVSSSVDGIEEPPDSPRLTTSQSIVSNNSLVFQRKDPRCGLTVTAGGPTTKALTERPEFEPLLTATRAPQSDRRGLPGPPPEVTGPPGRVRTPQPPTSRALS